MYRITGNFQINTKTNAYQAFRKDIYENRLTKINSQYLSYYLFSKMAQIFVNKTIRKLPVIRYHSVVKVEKNCGLECFKIKLQT